MKEYGDFLKGKDKESYNTYQKNKEEESPQKKKKIPPTPKLNKF